MLDKLSEALTVGIGLKPEHQRVLIRAGWVLFVSAHIAWVCGWLAVAGLASPFASAADQRKTEQKLEAMEKASRISAQIQIQSEIREQGYIYCSSPDERTKIAAIRRIDELRVSLREIADIDEPRPVCR